MARAREALTVGRRTITLTNPDKVLYPAAGLTKRQVVDYYLAAAPALLPHLKARPVTLKRYPEGVLGEHFYEKDAPAYTPEWVHLVAVPRRETTGPDIRYIVVDDAATLAWIANLASLEIHPFLHRAPHLQRPTAIVFDHDPGEGTDILAAARVALHVRDLLGELGLRSFAKVSGSKGLQVYAPLNTAAADYAVTQPFAKAVAEWMEERHPALVVSRMAKSLRAGRVFIDWSQNSDFKTTVAVYSLRAKSPRPYVSMPVEWPELERALRKQDAARAAAGLYWEPDAALERMAAGDPFKPVLSLKQRLPPEFESVLERKASPPRGTPPRTAPLRGAPLRGAPPRSSLATYRARRDFSRTPEPAPRPPRRSRQGGRRRFVIQKHAARRLHYDAADAVWRSDRSTTAGRRGDHRGSDEVAPLASPRTRRPGRIHRMDRERSPAARAIRGSP